MARLRAGAITRALHLGALLAFAAAAALLSSLEARAQAPAERDAPAEAGLAPAAAPAAEATPAEKFDVWEYRVLGSNVLPPRTIEQTLYSHLGPQKTIDDIETARQALEQTYRTAGYNTVFVDIPEQTVDRGVVRLNVTEGKLDRLRVSGARYFSNRQILAKVPALETGAAPYFPDVQKQLTALNRETPDRSVTPVLRAGRFPGTVDVELKVQDDLPFHGSFEVNNRYTADTTELRSSLTLGYNNLWQRAHTFSLQYQTAPEAPDEAKVYAVTYVARLEQSNTILAMYAVDSQSDVATVGTLSVLGNGKIFGVRGIRPLDSIGPYFHNMMLGIDFKDFDEDIRLSVDEGLQTPIKYVNWSASYGFGWTMPKSTSQFAVGASWGMRGFGNDDAEFENKRFKARANYLYLTGTGSHSRQVFGNARFVTLLGWQLANSPLINNEQFTAGGATTVRGYLEAEELGDFGANLSLELHSPPLVKSDRIADLHVFGFIDAASLRLEEALPGTDAVSRLGSAGAGFRFDGYHGFRAQLDWARVLRDGAHVLEGEDRVHFLLTYGF